VTNEILLIDAQNFCALAEEALDAGQSLRFRTNGQSMRPAILDGDIVTVAPLGDRGLGWGDIVLHRAGAGGLVLHRIVRVARRGLGNVYDTRGDAFGANSELVEEEDVLGRATTIERDNQALRVDRWGPRLRGLAWALRQALAQRYRTALKSLKTASPS